MKHEDTILFRRVFLRDRILTVPVRLAADETFCFPGWSSADFFGNSNQVKIEYCSGNGAWIAAQALAYPEYNWVAVERKWPRARKIVFKMKRHAISNLMIIYGEGLQTTSLYIPDGSVKEVFVNFPDPWPKKRHWKHRLIQKPFLQQVERILTSNGTITLVTDDHEYSEVMVKEVAATGNFSSCFPPPFYRTECQGYGSSYFEELWRSKGKEIRYHQFIKLRGCLQNPIG